MTGHFHFRPIRNLKTRSNAMKFVNVGVKLWRRLIRFRQYCWSVTTAIWWWYCCSRFLSNVFCLRLTSKRWTRLNVCQDTIVKVCWKVTQVICRFLRVLEQFKVSYLNHFFSPAWIFYKISFTINISMSLRKIYVFWHQLSFIHTENVKQYNTQFFYTPH